VICHASCIKAALKGIMQISLQENDSMLPIAAFIPMHLHPNDSEATATWRFTNFVLYCIVFVVIMLRCFSGVLNAQTFHFVFMMTIVYVKM